MVSVVRHRYNVIVRRMVKKGGRGGRERKYAEREEDRTERGRVNANLERFIDKLMEDA